MAWVFFVCAPLGYEPYLKEADAAYEKSPMAASLALSAQSQDQAVRANLAQSPFTLTLQGSGTWNQAYANTAVFGDPHALFSLGPSASVAYQPRSGFSATLQSQYTYSQLQRPTLFLSPSQPFGVSLNLTYDVIQGGLESTAWLAADSLVAGALAQRLTYTQQNIDGRIAFLGLMTDLYTTDCKAVLLDGVRRQVEETLAAARIQLKTRIMAQKDFLNFANLESNFATQLVDLESSRAALSEQARAYGQAAWKLADDLTSAHGVCRVDVDATLAQARSKMISEAELDAWSAALPQSLSAVAQQQSAMWNTRAVSKGNLPHLSPFVTGQYGQADYANQPLAQLIAGLTFTWNIPGKRGTYAEQQASLAAAAAEAQVGNTFLQSRSVLRQLNAALLYQTRVLDVLHKALANSDLLLKTLDTQRAIGQVDSLNFTTAYLDSVTVKESLLDARAYVYKSVFARDIYEAWVRSTKAPTK